MGLVGGQGECVYVCMHTWVFIVCIYIGLFDQV